MENINTITKITSKKNNIVLHINNNTYPIDSYYYECILPYVGKVLEVSQMLELIAFSSSCDILKKIYPKLFNHSISTFELKQKLKSKEISEDKMNEIIPVNGSMPAYLYYFVEAFLEEAVNEGLDYEVSKKLACEAINGSCKKIMESGKPTYELIKDVCSPGGATLAGLKVLEDEEFKKIIKDAYKACVKRAYELS